MLSTEKKTKSTEFDRSKVYENLDYTKEPQGYNSRIPWTVQQQIAATNGKHYIDLIGKLKDYPIFDLPLDAVSGNKLMLDIGCGWGRWLAAGCRKGYVPVGIDLRLEFCKTSRRVLKDCNGHGYTVVADLQHLPFQDNVFDLVWSFSVIQHVHKQRLMSCLNHINRILASDGFSFLEFPNKSGIRNRFGPVKLSAPKTDDFDDWAVRYYTMQEYRDIFEQHLGDVKFYNHSFLGIGVLKEDLKYVSFKNKLICIASLFGSFLTSIVPPLMGISDSLYLKSHKRKEEPVIDNQSAQEFFLLHQKAPGDNLNIIPLLRCPISGYPLILNSDKTKLLNTNLNGYYPVIDNIPIMILSEFQKS